VLNEEQLRMLEGAREEETRQKRII
jgi:hypothetical protein